jgi:hypothetical protein
MTLDSAVIDLTGAFEYGQGYVALSRVRSLAGLFLIGYNERALQVHPEILSVDTHFRDGSMDSEIALTALSVDERSRQHKQFIINYGGSFDAVEVEEKKVRAKKKSSVKKNLTYAATLDLFKQGKTIPEIIEARGLAESTIAGHIEKLYIDGKLEKSEILRIIPDHLIEVLPRIQQGLKESEGYRLTPVYEKFKGKYSFMELRLARMLM